ncbi:carbon starvation protein A [Labilibaculum sp. A4]|uniref:carbon starvation CstA family protein n=1 Tax=Labilibaculum euxinus TaxID=2686357 RepID=UPI000F619ED7|nr:carbon starvation CstA family protein [Labilibaculum euxinus]MDQ1769496.1 carbon starvation CstA family protein [Labilibaculum euxinus]MWN75020.1 carbon starvation protein A [Labilibaculum euxinus]
MITFLSAILALILGYIFYGKFIEQVFGADDTIKTPAVRLEDGVDFIPMPTWKMFTIQFLNIAGLGPIFGAILGAMYGPIAYIWIVLGCIFMGASHDYFSGMLSIRSEGASLPEIVGKHLGSGIQNFIRIFTILLLLFVGVAFVTGPAGLLTDFTGGGLNWWLYGIFAYYLLATLLPINKIIGKIYPLFGFALLLMAVSIAGIMIFKSATGALILNEISFGELKNLHVNPTQNILYPMMFIVISCGAISGFHSTQSPMMARCMKKESFGRPVFYGAMIAEGIVAIIWATAAMNFFGNTGELNYTISSGHNPAWIVNEICNTWLGKTGAIFAIIGVIACPITTGDTAFRSARLTIADIFNYNQKSIKNRLLVSIPLFTLGFILSQLEFSTIWKYLGLSNQILSMVMLWTAAVYLAKKGKNHLLLSIPALFMTAICFTYLLVAPNKNGGLAIDSQLGILLGIFIASSIFIWFLVHSNQKSIKNKTTSVTTSQIK